jgi:hypothetical protein
VKKFHKTGFATGFDFPLHFCSLEDSARFKEHGHSTKCFFDQPSAVKARCMARR